MVYLRYTLVKPFEVGPQWDRNIYVYRQLHNTYAIIIWRLHKVFLQNKFRLNQCSVSLYLSFMAELRPFKTYSGVQK